LRLNSKPKLEVILSEPCCRSGVYELRPVVGQGIIEVGGRRIRSEYRSRIRTLVSACKSLPALMDTVNTIENLPFAAALRPEVVASRTTDHALLEATRVGDEDAFAELVSRYKNQITSYIYRMTNDYDGAVDLAQETFV